MRTLFFFGKREKEKTQNKTTGTAAAAL